MLVLTRKPGEKIVVDGPCEFTFLKSIGDKARIGITAPADVGIRRAELEHDFLNDTVTLASETEAGDE